jgi:hypothetical protein
VQPHCMKEIDEGDSPKVIFAGDRKIAVDVLQHIKNDADIVALLLPPKETQSHSEELIRECEALNPKYIIRPEGEYPDSLISTLQHKNRIYSYLYTTVKYCRMQYSIFQRMMRSICIRHFCPSTEGGIHHHGQYLRIRNSEPRSM